MAVFFCSYLRIFILNLIDTNLFHTMHSLDRFATIASEYISQSRQRPVFPSPDSLKNLADLEIPLQDEPLPAETVLDLLNQRGSPATVQSAGGRYFGFVAGGSVPAALLAKLLATVWDQNAGLYVMSPVAAMLEKISAEWMIDLFGLDKQTAVGFVTGATMANFTALAAARNELLAQLGWDMEAKGLFGAPELTVITGEEVHVSLLKALRMIGFGKDRILRVPADAEGRMIAEKIPAFTGPAILCLQAGNVNTGAFDPIEKIVKLKKENVWIHVDAAFGLWAGASDKLKHLIRGINQTDSIATDAHKWLNVPYDCGLVFIKNQETLFHAMAAHAAYLPDDNKRDSFHYTPEMSREARGVPVWAALKSLGKKGLAEMIERHCAQARMFAEGLKAAGYEVLNDVVLNQVLVSFGEPAKTLELIRKIQEDGTCWCGGTVWQGRTAMRISVSSWATTDEDVAVSLAAMIRLAGTV